MKNFIKEYTLNVAIAVVILYFGSFVYAYTKVLFYTYADISNFFLVNSFVAEDVCYGDTKQTLKLDRSVYRNDIGYKAVVIKELGEQTSNGIVKVYDEIVSPFIQASPEFQILEQSIPVIQTGTYQWIFYPTLDIGGVQRADVPPIISNYFEVKNCI